MRKILFLCALWSACVGGNLAQGVGSWKSYLSYYNTTLVAEAGQTVYAAANGALYSYGKDDQSLRFLSRQNGLNGDQIANLIYNPTTSTLLIVYADGNIDLLHEDGTYNLPFLQTSVNVADPTVNSLACRDEYVYLAMNFGIVVVNTARDEITDTYRLDRSVRSVCADGSSIYAATDGGLLTASLKDNLLDKNQWRQMTLETNAFSTADITRIACFQGALCLFVPGQGVYYLQGNTLRGLCLDSAIADLRLERDKLLARAGSTTFICTSLTAVNRVTTGTTYDIACQNTSDTYWVAAGTDGLVGMRLQGGSMEVIASNLIALEDSPKRNYCDFMTFQQGKLLVAGGGREADRKNRPGTLMIYEGGKWTNIDENKVAAASPLRFSDVTSVAVDPNDPTHYFASTWGEGVYEFKDNEYANLYTRDNSTLASAVNSTSMNYTRVDGLCYDAEGNLWMNNTAINSCVNVLKSDGTWTRLDSEPYAVLNDHYIVDQLLITRRNHKWVNVERSRSGSCIVVFDDKQTIDDLSDDVVNRFTTFTNGSGGEAIAVNAYHCLAESKEGDIWIGTDRGPIICPVPERAINDPEHIYCTRIVQTTDDGINTYFLDNVVVKAIAVDGGNRKWIATEGNGVYLVSEDGKETLQHFTAANSPLLSDNVESVAIDDRTGEVFFGTENGIVSYMSDASEGRDDYSDVYAYPNPVRPEYADKVTITGLMENSNVKITDLAGNILYQGTSAGGQLTWNCRGKSGGRVASGVYLVLASHPDGGESVVTKIMVIK